MFRVPFDGPKAFDCSRFNRASRRGITRAFSYWAASEAPGAHLQASEWWDVEQTEQYVCNWGQVQYEVGPNENWQVVRSNGTVVASGQAGPNGAILFADCSPFDHLGLWIASYLESGGPVSPQPEFNWEGWTPGGGGGSGAPPPSEGAGFTGLTIAPSKVSAETESFPHFTATAHYDDGGEVDVTDSVTWISSSQTIAAEAGGGAFEATWPGVATITAQWSIHSASASVPLTVVASQELIDEMCSPKYEVANGNSVLDPFCRRRMTSAEMDTIATIMNQFRGNPSNDTAHVECDSLFGWLDAAINQTRAAWQSGDTSNQLLYIGARNGPPDDPDLIFHSGDTYEGKSHVDPWVFDTVFKVSGSANKAVLQRSLLASWLHEIAHLHNKTHPDSIASFAEYQEFDWFKFIETSAPSRSCVSWSWPLPRSWCSSWRLDFDSRWPGCRQYSWFRGTPKPPLPCYPSSNMRRCGSCSHI